MDDQCYLDDMRNLNKDLLFTHKGVELSVGWYTCVFDTFPYHEACSFIWNVYNMMIRMIGEVYERQGNKRQGVSNYSTRQLSDTKTNVYGQAIEQCLNNLRSDSRQTFVRTTWIAYD